MLPIVLRERSQMLMELECVLRTRRQRFISTRLKWIQIMDQSRSMRMNWLEIREDLSRNLRSQQKSGRRRWRGRLDRLRWRKRATMEQRESFLLAKVCRCLAWMWCWRRIRSWQGRRRWSWKLVELRQGRLGLEMVLKYVLRERSRMLMEKDCAYRIPRQRDMFIRWVWIRMWDPSRRMDMNLQVWIQVIRTLRLSRRLWDREWSLRI